MKSLLHIHVILIQSLLINFSKWSSLTALKTVSSSQSFSNLSSNSQWEMCSSGSRTSSVQPDGKYRSIWHMKISEIWSGILGRMEQSLNISSRENLSTSFRGPLPLKLYILYYTQLLFQQCSKTTVIYI